MAAKYTSDPLPLPPESALDESSEWLIQVDGVNQAGPSFEARVFLNNESVDKDSPRTPENGYAGSFHVYGYGLPANDGAPSLPMERSVEARTAIEQQLAKGARTARVTILPIMAGTYPGQATSEEPLKNVSVDIRPKS